MLGYIVRRAIQLIPVVLFVTVLNFALIHAAPGDPAIFLAGQGATPLQVDQVRNSYGLNRPLLEQLLIYASKILQGDLGYSLVYGRPVVDILLERMSVTGLLMVTSLIIALLVGVLLGVLSAIRPYSKMDNAITTSSLVLYSLPPFWVGILLLLAFAFYLRLFPIGGMMTIGVTGWPQTWLDVAWHLVLPVAVLAAGQLATYTRLVRANMLEVVREDYIMLARSKGCTEIQVFFVHALKNALLPVITMVALQIRAIFTGAILTETVFGWPGLGRLIFDAITTRDYNLLLGLFFIVSLVTVMASLAADATYAIADPRIKYETKDEKGS